VTTPIRRWGLFAEVRVVESERKLVRVGDERSLRLKGATEIVPACCTEDPDGPWYGWVQRDGNLVMVQPRRAAFEIQFPYGAAEYARKGLGEVVRLVVEEP
jgi:hypothetical protein